MAPLLVLEKLEDKPQRYVCGVYVMCVCDVCVRV